MNTLFNTGARKDKTKAEQMKENNMAAGGGMAYGEAEENKTDAFDDIVNQARNNSQSSAAASQAGRGGE